MLLSPAVDSDPNPLDDPQSLYDLYIPDLVNYAVNELRVPRREAEELATGILLASIRQLSTIPDVTTWLRGAMDMAVRRPPC